MFENFSNKLIFQALIILDEEEQSIYLKLRKLFFCISLICFIQNITNGAHLIHIWNWKILQLQQHQFKTIHFAVKFKNVEIFKHNMLRLSTSQNCRFNKKKICVFRTIIKMCIHHASNTHMIFSRTCWTFSEKRKFRTHASNKSLIYKTNQQLKLNLLYFVCKKSAAYRHP